MIKKTFNVKSTTIRELRDMNIDTQPVGQRLPVSSSKDGNSKSVSIIETIFNGVQITSKYKWFESELNCLPVDLLNKENILEYKFFSNNKKKRHGTVSIDSININCF